MKLIALAAALSLVAAPTVASAAPRQNAASSLSIAKSNVRASTPITQRGQRLSGGGILENPAVSVLLAVAAIAGILAVSGALDDGDAPASS